MNTTNTEEITQRYLSDLEKLFSVRCSHDRDLYANAIVEINANKLRFIWADPQIHLFPRFISVFGDSDVVWILPSVFLADGRMAIDVLLIDHYIDE